MGLTTVYGVLKVAYTYDAWGNVLSVTGPLADTLGYWNPCRYRGYVYDKETGFYYLQSRYYNPEVGRFINADALVATGQGLLGNNMFAYCGNNPVIYFDPNGNACVMTCSGDVNLLVKDLSGFHSAIGGGGGGLVTEKPKTSGSLKDNEKWLWGGTSHGQILPWEFDLLNVSNEGFTLIDASVSLIDANVEWEHSSVTLLSIFNAEVSAGITKEDGVHAGIMATMLSSDITISLWFIEVELTGYVGAIGGKVSLNTNGVSFAFAPGGIGGGISVKWDFD